LIKIEILDENPVEPISRNNRGFHQRKTSWNKKRENKFKTSDPTLAFQNEK